MEKQANRPGAVQGRRFVRIGTAAQRLGVSRSTLYLWISQGRLPAPSRIGPNCAGYFEADLDAWMAQRAAEFRAEGLA